MATKGLSTVAVQVEDYDSKKKKWTRKKKRPNRFCNKQYGLVVHTSGSGITSRAVQKGLGTEGLTGLCIDHYLESGGTHYLNTYEGTIIQLAEDSQLAYGASVTDQNKQHPWDANLSSTTSNLWKDRWEHLENVKCPKDLYPAEFANACYVHVEMPPVYGYGKQGDSVKLALPKDDIAITHVHTKLDFWFTEAQHDAVVKLAIDLADRNNWPQEWWKTGRLVGHEDVSPFSRSKEFGGWDPGALRKTPRFDWKYVYDKIEEEYAKRATAKLATDSAELVVKDVKGPDPYEAVVRSFVNFVSSLFERKKK